MLGLETKTDWKYFKIEVIFFIFICYLSAIISDMEYSFYEENRVLNFVASLEARLVWGSFFFLFYATYYWCFLKKYVFQRRTAAVIISIVFFIVCSRLYERYVMNWLIINFTFLSAKLRSGALKELNRPHVYFIISYTLNRIVFTIIGFTFLIRSLQQDEQLKTLKEQQLMTELNYLKAQLQPHFFFNTLNNIYALAMKGDKATAPMLAKLAEMMRYMIYETDQPKVSLKRDIDFLVNYVEIEKIRHHHQVNIDFDVQGATATLSIEPLLLLPFVENAFKHGLQEETGEGFIRIVICLVENELTLEVMNSKPKILTRHDFGGVGLANVKKRLSLLYPQNSELNVHETADSFHIILTLTLK